ncbi:MAG: ABC transporter ATP-binding protein [Armatimonadota bacterium]|nr:ABC transporter ATP-binding protein [Armatimonadota bacterium]MDR7437240.1 ABC transporter ATP-binding protein [Armatimonadota bacterium]MDR7473040.1 ABC transporter ATP-binding protein [Armatimonadota bacterium]MDR7506162.1 ABC transporter ATP-binding protein [Armatimonadota bacterium]MDR7509133.1 ABC transporter ATP-binding protein [Armatimonadota bacterium]
MSVAPAAPEVAVDVRGLTKRFAIRITDGGPPGGLRPAAPQTIAAVEDATFQVRRGELLSLLGPNGAGKTTLLRVLATLLAPTAGTARVWGYDVATAGAQVRRHIGVVLGGARAVYGRLSGRENLEYAAALHGLPRPRARERIAFLLDLVGLAPRADDLVERYSTGMRQRLALARALVHDPPVLLLDEPTAGLDPAGARVVRDLIGRLCRQEGKTVLLATHQMDEADRLSDRVGILDRGRLAALDSPAALKSAHGGGPVLRLVAEGPVGDALHTLPGAAAVSVRPTAADGLWEIEARLSDPGRALSLAAKVARHAGRIRRLQVVEPSLEDVFFALTGRRLHP